MNHLRLIMFLGALFALTPPKSKLRKLSTKLYAIFVAATITASSTVSVVYYRQELYVNFTEIKLVLTFSMIVIVNIFNCYAVLAPVFCKRRKYAFLVKMLEDPVAFDGCLDSLPVSVKFAAPTVVYWLINTYVAYVWTDILGFAYFQEYFVEVVQLYFQFYYSCFLCKVVRIVWGKYKQLNVVLSEQILFMSSRSTINRVPLRMKRIEILVCSLKELTEAFNDVFGWAIILIILYSSLLLLNYLDDIFKNSFGYDSFQFVGVIVSNISVVFISNIGTIILILLCDAVLDEAKTSILLSYKLRQLAILQEKREITDFIKLLVDNLPKI